jgi:HprK-related kinase A
MIGGFDVALRSTLPQVIRGVAQMYADFRLSADGQFMDFRINLSSPSLLRRWFRPQVNFAFDGKRPFKPLPINQAFAMFEWGLNWVIANHAHQFAIVHAAAVEKDGRGLIFPGAPGSGKSTLCAALVCRGWRLLSDEMAMISLRDGLIWPIPRPISLKNASIEIIRKFGNGVVIGDVVADTAKGNVAHMRPPKTSVESVSFPARPFAVVFPTYRAEAETDYAEISKGRTLMRLAENCFNYPVLGSAGFNCLADTVDQSRCRTLIYSDLDDAIAALER